MDCFFVSYPSMEVTFEEIVPREETPQRIRDRAVYADFIAALKPTDWDQDLASYRDKAREGALQTGDFGALNTWFMDTRRQLLNQSDQVVAFEAVNQTAMLIGQILFVDNCVKEGLSRLLSPENLQTLLRQLVAHMGSGKPEVAGAETRFYALLYVLQTAFDKIFVPDEDIVRYEPESGEFRIHSSYDQLTAYLNLSNKKVITACDREKELCYNITTGWGHGIDRQIWDELNRRYYSGSDEHFFSKYYHTTLERMLPQFGYGRVRLAGNLVDDACNEESLQVLEIGAGSGSFTLDLHMAIKRSETKTDFQYLGVEPSLLKEEFKDNLGNKVGSPDIPAGWRLKGGALEDVTADPDSYIDPHRKTVIVLSYSAHHCYHQSLIDFLENRVVRDKTEAIYFLDGTNEHGWTKWAYMWIDVSSPENFDNLHASGIWNSELVWQEPCKPISGYAVTNAWCQLRKLT